MYIYIYIFTCGPEWSATQSYLTACDPMYCSPTGSSVHGIFQAGILESVAISSSRGSFWLRDRARVSYVCWIGRQVLYRYCHLGSPIYTQANIIINVFYVQICTYQILILWLLLVQLFWWTNFIFYHAVFESVFQFSSVSQSCPTLCDLMDCSMAGFPVPHQLPEFTQTHVQWVGDAIQQFHPL